MRWSSLEDSAQCALNWVEIYPLPAEVTAGDGASFKKTVSMQRLAFWGIEGLCGQKMGLRALSGHPAHL